MQEENPGEEKPAEPVESAAEPVEPTPEVPAEPMEPTPEVPAEPTTLMEPPTPKKTIRNRKPKQAAAPSIVMPEIDDRFWATLLRTQREAERATKLQRISEFNLL